MRSRNTRLRRFGTEEEKMDEVLENTGAGDGARTRDLRRDRPAL